MSSDKDIALPPLRERARIVYTSLGTFADGRGKVRTIEWSKRKLNPEDAVALLYQRLMARHRLPGSYPLEGVAALLRLLEENNLLKRDGSFWTLNPIELRVISSFRQPAFVQRCNILLDVLRNKTRERGTTVLVAPISATLISLLLAEGHLWAEGLRPPWEEPPGQQTTKVMFDALVRRGLVKVRRENDALFIETKSEGRL